ncbi:hypothetical protein FHW69_002321 [Luteibacter sp. Sphag1AF]|uniref:hypothetical protein n=1 Tax=Luteibacter sp. Sphag1AF TaxID=2587031 RepID=UPI00160D8064|nr:hypothetical protein [Luteibacter sp. Sphag1AF]MBB3227698.1 hypothetical protein [Luteibacter sp. Sphag1AF]
MSLFRTQAHRAHTTDDMGTINLRSPVVGRYALGVAVALIIMIALHYAWMI